MTFLIISTLLLGQLQPPSMHDNELTLTFNMGAGSIIQLSNGEIYAIAPEDQVYSSLWITPFPVSLSSGDNADYPLKITNLRSGSSVNGRLLTAEEMKELKITPTPSMQPKEQMAPSDQPYNPNNSKDKGMQSSPSTPSMQPKEQMAPSDQPYSPNSSKDKGMQPSPSTPSMQPKEQMAPSNQPYSPNNSKSKSMQPSPSTPSMQPKERTPSPSNQPPSSYDPLFNSGDDK